MQPRAIGKLCQYWRKYFSLTCYNFKRFARITFKNVARLISDQVGAKIFESKKKSPAAGSIDWSNTILKKQKHKPKLKGLGLMGFISLGGGYIFVLGGVSPANPCLATSLVTLS